MNEAGNPTSLKQMFQGMVPENCTMIQGVVTKASPLTIQIVNNPKMILSGKVLICPRHLTNYTAAINIALGKGEIDSETPSSGEHEGHMTGTGEHTHKLNTFNLSGAAITVLNALKAGEKVWLLRFQNGKQYYILDRVVS
ncbi:DUF2577 family protein [Anaerovorax sp. IOR16]|uniref:DUF2577 family protein n=1 Tax=Anaerovorax sp. IOR16 TaxID=2773458 RepID=UPI0019D0019F|nr:DUF2577 family protein [Anaerovorax sp. IOR16]